jgi:hypothetical protein
MALDNITGIEYTIRCYAMIGEPNRPIRQHAVFAKVVESSSFAGVAAQKGFQVDRPRLTFPVGPGVHPRPRIR